MAFLKRKKKITVNMVGKRVFLEQGVKIISVTAIIEY